MDVTEVDEVIRQLIAWKVQLIGDVDKRINIAANPNYHMEGRTVPALTRMKNKIKEYCDRHIEELSRRIAQLLSEETVIQQLQE